MKYSSTLPPLKRTRAPQLARCETVFEGDGGEGGTSERRLSFAANLIVDQHREAVAENTGA